MAQFKPHFSNICQTKLFRNYHFYCIFTTGCKGLLCTPCTLGESRILAIVSGPTRVFGVEWWRDSTRIVVTFSCSQPGRDYCAGFTRLADNGNVLYCATEWILDTVTRFSPRHTTRPSTARTHSTLSSYTKGFCSSLLN